MRTSDVEVFVDGVSSPQVMRAILGYATFEVPASLTGQDAEVEVVVETDGTVVERLPLLLKRSPDIPAVSAKEDVLGFLAELAGLIADQQQAGADFIEQNGGLSADDTAIVLGVADAAAQQLEAATAELELLLDGEGGEELATILQAALYANGLTEFRARNRAASQSAETRAAGGRTANSVRDVRDVCDEYVPAICALKRIDTGLSYGATVATALCTVSGLASSLALVPTRGSSGILFGYVVKFCTPVAVALEIATTLSGLINGISLDMRLTTDKDVLTETGDTATITAEVTFFGLLDLCHKDSTAYVTDRFAGGINKRIAKLLMKRSKRLALVRRIAEKLGKSETAFFFMAIENAVGYALTRGRMDLAFQAAAEKLCEYLNADTAAERNFVGIPADGNEFNLVVYAGTQRVSAKEFHAKDDGTGTYRLACPADFTGTLVVKGEKDLCGNTKSGEVKVSCSCTEAMDEPVDIPDAGLHAAIAETLNKDASEAITRTEIASLWYLDASERNIRSLSGLECATALTSANLEGNRISDLSPLSGLTDLLQGLHLSNNEISDVSPLSGLTALVALSLSHNPILDVSSLSGLPNLANLFMHNNPITSVSLSDLPALTILSLRNNRISRLSLSGVPALVDLSADNNQIADLSSLSDLTTLKSLSLRLTDNEISDIGPLVSNKGLGRGDHLYLRGNPLSKRSCCTHGPVLEKRGVFMYDFRFHCERLHRTPEHSHFSDICMF